MYTVNKGPSKLVAKTRGGLNTFKAIDIGASNDHLEADRLNPQRPVFHTPRKNHHNQHSTRDEDDTPPATPQHEELVKFVQDSWTSLSIVDDMTPSPSASASTDCKSLQHSDVSSARRTVHYAESPSAVLNDFGAFDLEAWWGRRLFNNITNVR